MTRLTPLMAVREQLDQSIQDVAKILDMSEEEYLALEAQPSEKLAAAARLVAEDKGHVYLDVSMPEKPTWRFRIDQDGFVDEVGVITHVKTEEPPSGS